MHPEPPPTPAVAGARDAPRLARLLDRIADRTARIGIIGLGYVGIPLARSFCEAGFSVLGLDIDPARVRQLRSGESPIGHVPPDEIVRMLDAGFVPTDDYAVAATADVLIICVPTPLTAQREPDLSFIVGTMGRLGPHLRPGQLLSLESTSYPGTTEELLAPVLTSAGMEIGHDIFLVFSPEREDPGNPDFTTRTIPKIVGGMTEACRTAGVALYAAIIDRVVPVSDTRTAEMVKLLENIHRAVNIGLVNEMKIVADRMGIDIFEVIHAAATKPFGFTPYFPGPGLGGHCIPVDPFYLTWKARAYGVHTRFIEIAGEINQAMPRWVADKVILALNERGRAVKGARVLALGIAYKRNVDDMRESPAVQVMEILRGFGADLSYADPHIPVFKRMRRHRFDLRSVELTAELLAAQDLVLLLTDHDAFDYGLIRTHAPLIVDTRGRYRGAREAKIIPA